MPRVGGTTAQERGAQVLDRLREHSADVLAALHATEQVGLVVVERCWLRQSALRCDVGLSPVRDQLLGTGTDTLSDPGDDGKRPASAPEAAGSGALGRGPYLAVGGFRALDCRTGAGSVFTTGRLLVAGVCSGQSGGRPRSARTML